MSELSCYYVPVPDVSFCPFKKREKDSLSDCAGGAVAFDDDLVVDDGTSEGAE